MSFPSEIPANYDAVTLSVDPGGLNSTADAIYASVQDISNYLSAINNSLSGLTLSWAGSSASAATQYNDEWNSAVQALFGTQSDPDSGALSTLVNGLYSAVQNYDGTESNIAGMFNQFSSGFSNPSPSSSGPAQPDAVTGYMHTTAVNES